MEENVSEIEYVKVPELDMSSVPKPVWNEMCAVRAITKAMYGKRERIKALEREIYLVRAELESDETILQAAQIKMSRAMEECDKRKPA